MQSRLSQAVRLFILEIHHAGPANEDTRSLLQIHSAVDSHTSSAGKREEIKAKESQQKLLLGIKQISVQKDILVFMKANGDAECAVLLH